MEDTDLKKVGLYRLEEGVFFYPPSDGFEDYESLQKEMLKIGVVDLPFDKVEEIMENGTEKPVKICDRLEEYNVFKDDYIQVMVSKDGLEAYLDLSYPGTTDDQITFNDILHKIYEADVTHNIDIDKIKKAVKNTATLDKDIIARGKEPIIGAEAQIVLEVDTDINTEPLIMDDGSVDFRQVNMLKTVEKDQLLAVKIPAQKGEDGIDVRGNPIDSTGPDKPLPAGKNTYISEDGLSLYASLSGRILREKEKFQVENILAIEGDIDFSTGNIEFNGDVAISGDVLTGFRVKSDGDIRIKGTVEGAEIISTKGSIHIKRGIVGQEKARILAKEDIYADFINEATIEAGNDVEVGEYIINSTISAERDVRATNGRGMIIGGKIYAGQSIAAKVIGSQNNVRTEVRIGGKIDKELYEKMLLVEKDIENLEKRHQSIRKDIEFIETLKKKLPKFPESKVRQLKELILKLKKLEGLIEKTKEKKKQYDDEFGSSVKEEMKKINANTLHRNVLMGIDQNKLLAEYTYKLIVVYSVEGEMKLNYRSRFV